MAGPEIPAAGSSGGSDPRASALSSPGLAGLLGPFVTLLTLAAWGCAGGGAEPATLPPVSESKAEVPKPKERTEDPVAAPTPPTTVVIDRGAESAEKGPKNLADAAREERERRSQAGRPVAVIDNQNLADFSRGQRLTVAEEGSPGAASPATAAVAKAERDEVYWRERGLEIRRRWREAADRISELENQAEELRRRFYAADDPYVRDSQIKPDWDNALDELDSTRREVERSEAELEQYLDEGRRAGAFPGWLREGADLEPPRSPVKNSGAEPSEPVEVQESQDPP
jgi:hypothetical protein